LKGVSERFQDAEDVDAELFISALERGVECAYLSVATPVEGTMLTVLRDATNAVKNEFDGSQSVDEVISSFVVHARVSLDNTPELLPVLKESGVVDSGGAGVVYLFEGMQKYLAGEDLEDLEMSSDSASVDYNLFDRESVFDYGYCTELLLQLLDSKESFDYDSFKESLSELGNSIVVSAEGSKVKLHVHTMTPETVFELCHRFGEFLSVKVENMTVQHTEKNNKFLVSEYKNEGAFSIVAVASDRAMQELFVEMGADVSLCCDEGVSTKDYLDAFEKTSTGEIIVFPNNSDAILSAVQAKQMYKNAKVHVIPTKNVAECYAALPAVDFEETDVERVRSGIVKTLSNIYVASVAKRKTPIKYGETEITADEYYSYSGKELSVVKRNLYEAFVQTVIDISIKQYDKEIMTVFYKSSISESDMENMIDAVKEFGIRSEICTVPTDSLQGEITISFE
jgi:DAK2 domain fusion protein YloV